MIYFLCPNALSCGSCVSANLLWIDSADFVFSPTIVSCAKIVGAIVVKAIVKSRAFSS